MAGTDGQTADALIAQFGDKLHESDFCAFVRFLQSRFPDQPRIGRSLFPAQDPVRFAQSPALDFAPATMEAMKRKDPSQAPVIYSRHFGLFGPNGPLPLCLTEYARDRILHHGDSTFAAFCDVFHHRLTSFFFRAWADAHKTVDLDRPGDQSWPHFLGSLIGVGMETLLEQDSVPDRAKLFFAGRLVQQSRNAEGLEAIVQSFFGVKTEVCTFVGKWLNLPEGSACKLGDSPQTGSLGSTVILGSRVWTCQLHFRLRLGPMKFADFSRMLPTGGAFRRLRDWVRLYIGHQFSWDVQLILDKEEVPVTRLGSAGQLGWTTWLKTKPGERDADHLVITPEPAV